MNSANENRNRLRSKLWKMIKMQRERKNERWKPYIDYGNHPIQLHVTTALFHSKFHWNVHRTRREKVRNRRQKSRCFHTRTVYYHSVALHWRSYTSLLSCVRNMCMCHTQMTKSNVWPYCLATVSSAAYCRRYISMASREYFISLRSPLTADAACLQQRKQKILVISKFFESSANT